MKKNIFCFLCIIFSMHFSIQSQNTIKGSVVKNFGQFYALETIDLNLDKSIDYKVIFDVYTDEKSTKKINSGINTLARFLNMHAHQNINPDRLNLVLVLHGEATKNALSNVAFKKKFKTNNPNAKLLEELDAANVKIYVCGQSLAHSGFKKVELHKNVNLALSALTTLVYYQNLNYQLITFN